MDTDIKRIEVGNIRFPTVNEIELPDPVFMFDSTIVTFDSTIDTFDEF